MQSLRLITSARLANGLCERCKSGKLKSFIRTCWGTAAAVWVILANSCASNAQVLYDWNNAAGGSYHSAINWFPGAGAPPDAIDGAAFGLAGNYTVNFFSDAAVSDIYVVNGDVTFDLNAGGVARQYNVQNVEVTGFGSTPRLTVRDGTMKTEAMLVSNGGQFDAATPGSAYARNLTVTGIGSTWTSATGLALPAASGWNSASLNVTGGGNVTNQGGGWIGLNSGDATAVISGADSQWTNVGELVVGYSFDTTGALIIEAGGAVSSSSGVIGHDAALSAFPAHGTVTVTGTESTWANSGSVDVGQDGVGTLVIEDGAIVYNEAAKIGVDPSGYGTVDISGPGSTWTSTALTVGHEGVGFLSNISGGAVTSSHCDIGASPGATGTVMVSGAGSTWNDAGGIRVGVLGSGMLIVEYGGFVTTAGSGSIAAAPGSRGVAMVLGAGSEWQLGGSLDIGGSSGTGFLNASFGGRVSAPGGVRVFAQGTITGDGFIDSDVSNAGVISPAGSTGKLHLNGDYTQLSVGKLDIDITSSSLHESLQITGSATLGGMLDVSLLQAFVPEVGDTFEILSATDGVIGQFASLVSPALPTGLTWTLRYGPTNVTLDVLPALSGDFDHDADVDGNDIGKWKEGFGVVGSATHMEGDADGDRDVDGDDFLVWQRQVTGPTDFATRIPEPSIFTLTTITIGASMYRRRLAFF